ncbi:MAG: dicarboxylate/amino acid:cation symporter [Cytophagaceae bacterium]
MTAKKKKKFPLYIRILFGMTLGITWGLLVTGFDEGPGFTKDFIKPLGTIFFRLLSFIAVPLVLASLIVGVANLKDMTKLARMGGRTLLLFLCTAFIATSLGLILVNISQPGKRLSEKVKTELMAEYNEAAEKALSKAAAIKESPMQPLVDIVPDNIFGAMSENARMAQVVFFALLFGIAIIKIDPAKGDVLITFFDAVNEVLIRLVTIIMQIAPFGVFALIASIPNLKELISPLLIYMGTVVVGLLIMLLVIYPMVFMYFSKIGYGQFFKQMRPALLLAFTTSSSSATLPVTMERVEKHLEVPKDITGFVLPLGTTINMDGTALYQAVAAVFMAQALGIELSILQMVMIVVTATIAAAGAAGIPGAGMITLIIVMDAVHIPPAAIALIMAPDRFLDMCRTVINVAGDAVAAVVIAGTEEKTETSNSFPEIR